MIRVFKALVDQEPIPNPIKNINHIVEIRSGGGSWRLYYVARLVSLNPPGRSILIARNYVRQVAGINWLSISPL